MIPPGGVQTFPNYREQVIRPLPYISPRKGRAASSTVTIELRMDFPRSLGFEFGVDPSEAQLFVNGIDSSALLSSAGATAPAGGFAMSPFNIMWQIPMANVTAGIGATTPIRLSFVIRSKMRNQVTLVVVPPHDPITEQLTTLQVPIVAGVGRNDVIL